MAELKFGIEEDAADQVVDPITSPNVFREWKIS
jgi:hypothetical protein